MSQQYIYRARTVSNQSVTGKVEADNPDMAKKILLKNQLTPISISVPKSYKDYLPFFNRVGLKEKTLFGRQLSTMIESGLTLAQSLRLLIKQSKKNTFQKILSSVLDDIQDGFSFSSSLAKYPEVFDTVFINVVRSGEATGKLETVLAQLATTMEKEVSVQSKIKGALFYPAFILLAMLGVALVMTTKVIPQLKEVFASSNQALPPQTILLLKMSDFLINDWWLAIILTVGGLIGLRAFLRAPIGVRFFSHYILKVPIAGAIVEQTNMGRFGRLLGMLLGSGVPLLEALRLVRESFTNMDYKDGVADVAAQVERGVPMSVPISNNSIFPTMVGQMVAVGEQTGKMDEIMTRMAAYYESEVDAKISGFSTLIEPIIILVLGIGVAWLVTAILLPIYQISTSAG
jgi:type IV pilus assembly protein PilC